MAGPHVWDAAVALVLHSVGAGAPWTHCNPGAARPAGLRRGRPHCLRWADASRKVWPRWPAARCKPGPSLQSHAEAGWAIWHRPGASGGRQEAHEQPGAGRPAADDDCAALVGHCIASFSALAWPTPRCCGWMSLSNPPGNLAAPRLCCQKLTRARSLHGRGSRRGGNPGQPSCPLGGDDGDA